MSTWKPDQEPSPRWYVIYAAVMITMLGAGIVIRLLMQAAG